MEVRVKKIWSSEIPDFNKTVAHNTFATPVIAPTVGVIDWTIEEIDQLNLKTRKTLTFTSNFYPNSDIDRLHMSRTNGGIRLERIKILFESRMVSESQQLKLNSKRSQLLKACKLT